MAAYSSPEVSPARMASRISCTGLKLLAGRYGWAPPVRHLTLALVGRVALPARSSCASGTVELRLRHGRVSCRRRNSEVPEAKLACTGGATRPSGRLDQLDEDAAGVL